MNVNKYLYLCLYYIVGSLISETDMGWVRVWVGLGSMTL